jgi:type VI secretion system VgrG family protein
LRSSFAGPYSFDVVTTVTTDSDEELERLALGQRAAFVWKTDKGERAFYGVVAAVRLARVHEIAPRSIQIHVRLVPRLWLLKRRKRTRIFQGMRAPEIIDAVLEAAGISARWQLLRDHAVRTYVTQYEESDLAFVKRLCAEAGIAFYFPTGVPLEPGAADDAVIPGDTVIFADDASFYPPMGGDDPGAFTDTPSAASNAPAAGEAPTLYHLGMEETNVSRTDKVLHFASRTVVKATSTSYRDYDPERPMARPSSSAAMPQPASEGDAAQFSAAPAGLELEVYEHHSPFLFPQWSWAADEAAVMLRQKRRRASTAGGESGAAMMAPGHRFVLADHPAAHLDRAWVVTSVEHHGRAKPGQGEREKSIYANRFACVPAEVTFVPPRPKRKSVQVALTATVVGPAGEEIHVDAMGQIKVQFHWDREGGFDDRSSCWIRVMQAWAGAGFGSQFIPRIGQEVVVTFEGGDPDKPIVLGAVYNGTHPPPFLLPGDKTRSGIKTQSSPGGSGSNELSFEDAAGNEQVYVHAQRDLDEVAERNHTLLVRGDERLRVLGSRVDIVEEDVIARVGHNVEEFVGGDRTSQVEGNRIDVVTGNSDERVSGALVTRVEGRERRDVKRNVDLVLAEDFTTRVLGCMTTLVGTADAKRSWVTHAEGLAKISSLETTEVSSEGELVLRVGKSSIRITSEKIEINSPAVTVKGEGGGLSADDEGLKLGSKKDAVFTVEKKIVIKTKDGASIAMEKEVKVDGEKILLNSPEQAKDAPPKEAEPPTKIELTDEEDGKAIPYQRFLVVMDDGSEVSGTLDKDGKAEIELKSGGKITFPDVTMPGDASGMDDLRPHVVRQGDYLMRLAWIGGFDADEVWKHEKNKELAELRKDHNILAPGDVLQLPAKKKNGLAIEKGAENKYKAKVPRVKIAMAFREHDGHPWADEPCLLYGADGCSDIDKPGEQTLNKEGILALELPVYVREIQVVFYNKNHLEFNVRVGAMDPIDVESGAQRRLGHLGFGAFDRSEPDLALSEDPRPIVYFQYAHNLKPTGVLDKETKDALLEKHSY